MIFTINNNLGNNDVEKMGIDRMSTHCTFNHPKYKEIEETNKKQNEWLKEFVTDNKVDYRKNTHEYAMLPMEEYKDVNKKDHYVVNNDREIKYSVMSHLIDKEPGVVDNAKKELALHYSVMKVMEFIKKEKEDKNNLFSGKYTIWELKDKGIFEHIMFIQTYSDSKDKTSKVSMQGILKSFNGEDEDEFNVYNVMKFIRDGKEDEVVNKWSELHTEEKLHLFINNMKMKNILGDDVVMDGYREIITYYIATLDQSSETDMAMIMKSMQYNWGDILYLIEPNILADHVWSQSIHKYMGGVLPPYDDKYRLYEVGIKDKLDQINSTLNAATLNKFVKHIKSEIQKKVDTIDKIFLKKYFYYPEVDVDKSISMNDDSILDNIKYKQLIEKLVKFYYNSTKTNITLDDRYIIDEMDISKDDYPILKKAWNKIEDKYFNKVFYNDLIKKKKERRELELKEKPVIATSLGVRPVPKITGEPDEVHILYSPTDSEPIPTAIIPLSNEEKMKIEADEIWDKLDVAGISKEHIEALSGEIVIDIYNVISKLPPYIGPTASKSTIGKEMYPKGDNIAQNGRGAFLDDIDNITRNYMVDFHRKVYPNKPILPEVDTSVKSYSEEIRDNSINFVMSKSVTSSLSFGEVAEKFLDTVNTGVSTVGNIIDTFRIHNELEFMNTSLDNIKMSQNNYEIQDIMSGVDRYIRGLTNNNLSLSDEMSVGVIENDKIFTLDKFSGNIVGGINKGPFIEGVGRFKDQSTLLKNYLSTENYPNKSKYYFSNVMKPGLNTGTSSLVNDNVYTDVKGQKEAYKVVAKYRYNDIKNAKNKIRMLQARNILSSALGPIANDDHLAHLDKGVYRDGIMKQLNNLYDPLFNKVDEYANKAADTVNEFVDNVSNAVDRGLGIASTALDRAESYYNKGMEIADKFANNVAPLVSALGGIISANGDSNTGNFLSNLGSTLGSGSFLSNLVAKDDQTISFTTSNLRHGIIQIFIEDKELKLYKVVDYYEEIDYLGGESAIREIKLQIPVSKSNVEYFDKLDKNGFKINIKRAYAINDYTYSDYYNATKDDLFDRDEWSRMDEVGLAYVGKLKNFVKPKNYDIDTKDKKEKADIPSKDATDLPRMFDVTIDILPIIKAPKSKYSKDKVIPIVSYIPMVLKKEEVIVAKDETAPDTLDSVLGVSGLDNAVNWVKAKVDGSDSPEWLKKTMDFVAKNAGPIAKLAVAGYDYYKNSKELLHDINNFVSEVKTDIEIAKDEFAGLYKDIKNIFSPKHYSHFQHLAVDEAKILETDEAKNKYAELFGRRVKLDKDGKLWCFHDGDYILFNKENESKFDPLKLDNIMVVDGRIYKCVGKKNLYDKLDKAMSTMDYYNKEEYNGDNLKTTTLALTKNYSPNLYKDNTISNTVSFIGSLPKSIQGSSISTDSSFNTKSNYF